jgi:hypothetical protein
MGERPRILQTHIGQARNIDSCDSGCDSEPFRCLYNLKRRGGCAGDEFVHVQHYLRGQRVRARGGMALAGVQRSSARRQGAGRDAARAFGWGSTRPRSGQHTTPPPFSGAAVAGDPSLLRFTPPVLLPMSQKYKGEGDECLLLAGGGGRGRNRPGSGENRLWRLGFWREDTGAELGDCEEEELRRGRCRSLSWTRGCPPILGARRLPYPATKNRSPRAYDAVLSTVARTEWKGKSQFYPWYTSQITA